MTGKIAMDSILRETWYDEAGTHLTLTCDATSCLVELVFDKPPGERCFVEVLQQPSDRRGLRIGPAVTLLRQQVPCEVLPQSQRSVGRFWLPSCLVSRHIRNCYFRVTGS